MVQQAGTLRKRKKRNIAKVNGLSTIEYNERNDRFEVDNFHDRDGQRHTLSRQGSSLEKISVESAKSDLSSKSNFANEEEDRFDTNNKASTIQKYLLSDDTFIKLRLLLILGALSLNFPWKWKKKTCTVELWSNTKVKLWNIIWVINSIQTMALTCFQIYTFVSGLKGLEYRTIFMNSLTVVIYATNVFFNISNYLHKEEIRNFINSLLRMNELLVGKYVVSTEGYKQGGNILISVAIPSNTLQVFVFVTFFCTWPFQPWYLYSYIYKKENPWYWLIPGALHEFTLLGQLITNYMLTGWLIIAHTNSVNFWLKESHKGNDGTGYTKDSIREFNASILIYRTLQVICAQFNSAVAPLAIPSMKIHILFCIIPCTYVFFRSINQKFIDEFPPIMAYPVGTLNTATAGFAILSMGAEMYDLGCSFVESWAQTKVKFTRAVLRSLPSLKLKVGSLYFITLSTTITFFRCCTDFIIDCIITF